MYSEPRGGADRAVRAPDARVGAASVQCTYTDPRRGDSLRPIPDRGRMWEVVERTRRVALR